MAPRTVYASLSDGLNPLSLWDQSLADMGSLGVIPCTAAGTNAITLTPIAAVFAPNVTTPVALQSFSFLAAATSTGPVTVQVGATGALKLYKADGLTQVGSSDLQSGYLYEISYNAALNSSAGGFQISGSAGSAGTTQYITAGATITVAATDSLIIINKSVGSATTVNMPAALSKLGKVKIVDFKGDSDVNPITVNRNGSDTFNGGATSWTINAPGASVVFDPIVNGGASIGYAV